MGLCPRCCLWELGSDDDFVVPEPDPDLDFQLEVPGFEVISQIGTGAFGEVYECLEFEPAVRRVAVKILKMEMMGAAQRLKEETQILAGLDHPSVARLFSAGELSDRRPFYAMELVEGTAFLDWIQEEKPSLGEKVEVLTQMAGALAHAHSRGVVHRDLKPGNVLVMREGLGWRAKVIDFGVARAIQGVASFGREVTLADTWVGTPHYMSPEQMAGSQDVGPAADVYALGLLIFEALYEDQVLGGLVDTKKSWIEIYQAREQWRPLPWPEEVPITVRSNRDAKSLYWIASKATSWNEADRYSDGDSLHCELVRWREGETLEAQPSSLLYRFRRKLTKSGGAAFLLVSGLLVILGFALGGPIFFNYDGPVFINDVQVDRGSSDQLVREANLLLREGRAQEAKKRLEEAISQWPMNENAHLALAALSALTPEAKALPSIQLPARADRIWEMKDGRWGVVLENRRIIAVSDSGDIEDLKVPVPKEKDSWRGKTNIRWIARKVSSGRMEFVNSNGTYPVLQALKYSNGSGSVSVNGERLRVAAVDGSKELKRWDISQIGHNRHSVETGAKVNWMGFEEGGKALWISSQEGEMFCWRPGKELARTGQVEALKGIPVREQFSESHTKPVKTNFGNESLMGSLAERSKAEPDERILCAVGARDTDDAVLASDKGILLYWKEGKSMVTFPIEGSEDLKFISISADGSLLLGVSDKGELLIVDLLEQSLLAKIKTGTEITSAGILDNKKVAVLGTSEGMVRFVDLLSGELTEEKIDLQNGRLGVARTLVYCLPGRSGFVAATEGGLEIRGFNLVNGIREVFSMSHEFGVGGFFVSRDGQFLVCIDQEFATEEAASPKEQPCVRLWSLRTFEEVLPPFRHDDRISWVSYSPNSRVLATVTEKGSLRSWIFLKR